MMRSAKGIGRIPKREQIYNARHHHSMWRAVDADAMWIRVMTRPQLLWKRNLWIVQEFQRTRWGLALPMRRVTGWSSTVCRDTCHGPSRDAVVAAILHRVRRRRPPRKSQKECAHLPEATCWWVQKLWSMTSLSVISSNEEKWEESIVPMAGNPTLCHADAVVNPRPRQSCSLGIPLWATCLEY